MRRGLFSTLALVALVTVGACKTEKYSVDLDALSSFRVSIVTGDPGTAGNPHPYSNTFVPYTIQIQAIDGRGNNMAWNGRVKVTAVPGKVQNPAGINVDLVDGHPAGPVTVQITKAFGSTRIWVEDLGVPATVSTPAVIGTYASGVSDVLWFKQPSIQDIQTSTSTTHSPFEGQLVTVTAGTMVVTQITGDGFYVTDTSVQGFNSLYVYARVRAEDLSRGMTVAMLSGAISEYNGLTELNNPSWDAGGEQPGVPRPIVLDCNLQVKASGMAMEPLESSLVEVRDATIVLCDEFQASGADCASYPRYGQWIISLPCGGRLTVISRLTVPRLDPVVDHGAVIPVMRGILTQIAPAIPDWVLTPRDETDLCFEGSQTTFSGACPTP
jgi:hypothetical protein